MIDIINVPNDDKFQIIAEHAFEELDFPAKARPDVAINLVEAGVRSWRLQLLPRGGRATGLPSWRWAGKPLPMSGPRQIVK